MANPVPSISCQRPNIVIAMGGRPHVDGHALCRGRRSWGGDGIAHQGVMAKSPASAGAPISKPDGLGRAAVSYSPTPLSRREKGAEWRPAGLLRSILSGTDEQTEYFVVQQENVYDGSECYIRLRGVRGVEGDHRSCSEQARHVEITIRHAV